jgi:hypothetical protein
MQSKSTIDNNNDNISTSSSNACSICLSNLKDNIKTLECNHTFHIDCIDIWYNNNNTCPLCRKIINKPSNKLLNSNVVVPIDIYLPIQVVAINNQNNYNKIKKTFLKTLFIFSFIGSIFCSLYIDVMIFKANQYINNLINDKNTTELDGKSHNTFSADLLILYDIIYYSLYLLLVVCIYKNTLTTKNFPCNVFFFAALFISTWIIHSAFNANSLSYLNNDIINIKNDYY